MRLKHFSMNTALVLLHVIKLTKELATCDTTDQQRLECFTCSDESINKCTDSTGIDQFMKWNSIKSNEGEINTTRYFYYFK
jgi:hypothetical protein